MYLRIDEGFLRSPQVLTLCAHLRDANAAMYVLRLWTWSQRWESEGGLSAIDAWAVEDIAEYRPHDGRLYKALVDTGILVEEKGRRVLMCDWIERGQSNDKAAYGPRWKQIRDAIVARDGTCTECRTTERLEVHHIVPLRVFNGDHEWANQASNLTTLCKAHHAAADAAYRAAEAS